jgi:hypothetical protein
LRARRARLVVEDRLVVSLAFQRARSRNPAIVAWGS